MSGAVLVGILGCGRAAERLHLPALQRIGDARITAVYDPLPARRDLLARAAPGCRAFSTAEALVDARVVDAVIVASPPETHADLAALVLEARLPVLVEKPLATSIEDATWLAEARRAARLPLMVGFNRRWWEPAESLRRELYSPLNGPTSIETTIVSDLSGWNAVGGPVDPLEDLAVHHLDLLRYLVDHEIATVRARQVGEQAVELRLTFHEGATATCTAGFAERSSEAVVAKVGERTLALRAGSERLWPADGLVRRAGDVLDSVVRRVQRGRGSLTRSYERQLRGFISCVRSRGAASPGIEDGVAAVLAIDAARASLAQGGAEVAVPPTPGT
jgi:predicted dehydrogenase